MLAAHDTGKKISNAVDSTAKKADAAINDIKKA